MSSVCMAQEEAEVITVDTDSNPEEMGNPTEEALLSKNRSSFDIISVSSVEDIHPASPSRPNASNGVFKKTLKVPSAVLALENKNSDDVISVSSVEELNLPEPSKGNIAYEVNNNGRNIEEICICCGKLEIHSQHPLFHGGICAPCTEKFLERFFLCDDDGSQADCTICCWGNSLMICDDPKCHRCFCEECVDTLVCPGHSGKIKDTYPWKCFLCVPKNVHGLLMKKTKWREELKHFYDQESNSLKIYQPLSPWERKPIHVLSLFDNITQELKKFGFLGKNMGNGKVTYLDDVTDVTRAHIEEWGPFDLIFGSTPPLANSYKYPSAWYFYQYMRILQYERPPEGSHKPFFWLFVDNLVLDEEDRDTASRFFQVEAVLKYKQHDDIIQNAVHVWSNIPSVNSSQFLDSEMLEDPILKQYAQVILSSQVSKDQKLALAMTVGMCWEQNLEILPFLDYYSQNPATSIATGKYSAASLYVDLSLLAKEILETRIFSQRPATIIREFFVPLKDYFRAFS